MMNATDKVAETMKTETTCNPGEHDFRGPWRAASLDLRACAKCGIEQNAPHRRADLAVVKNWPKD